MTPDGQRRLGDLEEVAGLLGGEELLHVSGIGRLARTLDSGRGSLDDHGNSPPTRKGGIFVGSSDDFNPYFEDPSDPFSRVRPEGPDFDRLVEIILQMDALWSEGRDRAFEEVIAEVIDPKAIAYMAMQRAFRALGITNIAWRGSGTRPSSLGTGFMNAGGTGADPSLQGPGDPSGLVRVTPEGSPASHGGELDEVGPVIQPVAA